jgi:hypothetical protein
MIAEPRGALRRVTIAASERICSAEKLANIGSDFSTVVETVVEADMASERCEEPRG